jgi:hypothetical protein
MDERDEGQDATSIQHHEENEEAAREPRSILVLSTKVCPENVTDTKAVIDASKDELSNLTRDIKTLQRTITAIAVLTGFVIIEFMFSSPFLDCLCAPAIPFLKLTPADNHVYLEAPWWIPSQYKERAFPLLCGNGRLRAVVGWIPFDKKRTEYHRLVIQATSGDRMEVIHRDKKRLSSASLYFQKIVTVDQHSSTEDILAPWLKSGARMS